MLNSPIILPDTDIRDPMALPRLSLPMRRKSVAGAPRSACHQQFLSIGRCVRVLPTSDKNDEVLGFRRLRVAIVLGGAVSPQAAPALAGAFAPAWRRVSEDEIASRERVGVRHTNLHLGSSVGFGRHVERGDAILAVRRCPDIG